MSPSLSTTDHRQVNKKSFKVLKKNFCTRYSFKYIQCLLTEVTVVDIRLIEQNASNQ